MRRILHDSVHQASVLFWFEENVPRLRCLVVVGGSGEEPLERSLSESNASTRVPCRRCRIVLIHPLGVEEVERETGRTAMG